MYRLYNISADAEEAEQTFRLYSLPHRQPSKQYRTIASSTPHNTDQYSSPVALSFCFGSTQRVWDRFAIYFLMDNGYIYAICPVIPYNW